MTKILTLFSFLSVFSLNTLFAQVSGSFGTGTMTNKHGGSTVVIAFAEKELNPQFDVFSIAIAGEYWAEAYGGFVHQPADWFKYRIGFGLEQAEDGWHRFGGKVWLIPTETITLDCAIEDGAGELFVCSVGAYRSGGFGAGYMYQNETGIGPYGEYDIPATPVSIWGAGLFDSGQQAGNYFFGVMFGL